MKKVCLIMTAVLFITALSFSSLATAGSVRVRGYQKSNGTYVMPHTRTAPDGNKWNNKSNW